MSDTSHLLADCMKRYGDDGLRIYNRHRDMLYRIFTNPTTIEAAPPRHLRCGDCGSENILG